MKYQLDDGSTAEIGWDLPGWDWEKDDFSWLSPTNGGDGGFFIHGGCIRHQRHIPTGNYSVDGFTRLLHELAKGLDDPRVKWSTNTGGGDEGFAGLWVEGTRPPNKADIEALQATRKRQAEDDRRELARIKRVHPDWFR